MSHQSTSPDTFQDPDVGKTNKTKENYQNNLEKGNKLLHYQIVTNDGGTLQDLTQAKLCKVPETSLRHNL